MAPKGFVSGGYAVMASRMFGGGKSSGKGSGADPRECKFGAECTDFSEAHRQAYTHPEGITLACSYGSKCYRRNLDHLKQFVHPGDRNYRCGMVHFGSFKGRPVEPEFPTMRDLFNYCDPDESGNISEDEFGLAWPYLQALGVSGSVAEAWRNAAGDHTHLTFAQFAQWGTSNSLSLPVGIDIAAGVHPEPCRFTYLTKGGERCPCVNFTPVSGSLCECGHKSSVHQSDVALMTLEEQEVLRRLAARAGRMNKSMTLGTLAAPARKPGFDMVTDRTVLAALQQILTETHKTDADNWTRDRGCALHGRHACADSCIFRNRAPVPKGYEIVRAEKNRNPALMHTYDTTKAAIREECRMAAADMHQKFRPRSCMNLPGTEDLDEDINEWRLLHGTALAGCKGICSTNFSLKKAGTGATWKEEGKATGTPLYGWGVYLAERSTKADEYAVEITEGLPLDIGCHAMLVCRVVGGLTRLVDTNEFDPDALRTDVFDGPYHSVFGDREVKLGKPFREIVVYDNAQVFPEFILYYKRVW